MDYTFTLNDEEIQTLSSALVELPYKTAAPLIQKISMQIAQANAPKPAEEAEDGGNDG